MTNEEAMQVVVTVCEAHLCNGQDRNIIREALNTLSATVVATAGPAEAVGPAEAETSKAEANGRKRASSPSI